MTEKTPDRLLTIQEVAQIVPYSPRHIRRLEAAGNFPAAVRCNGYRRAYRLSQIQAWLDEQPQASAA